MNLQYPIVAGATVLSVGAVYWLTRKSKPRFYPYDKTLRHQSYPVNEKGDEHCSEPRITDDSLVRDMTNVCHLFLRGVQVSASKPCFGERKSRKEAYHWETYSDIERKIACVASMLDQLLGDQPSMVGIQSASSPEWLIVQLACAARGHVTVPLYATFGGIACRQIIEETKMELLFCGTSEIAHSLLEDAPTCVKHVILLQCTDSNVNSLLDTGTSALQIHVLQDFLKMDRNLTLCIKAFGPEKLFMICYTSGSTGTPKGVLIRHSQFIRTIKNLYNRLEDATLRECPVHMCYLPLAHILEQLASMTTLLLGGKIGFLTDELSGLLNDMRDVRPTYLFTVPRVLSRIYSTVQQRLSTSRVMPKLLHYAVESKLREQEQGYYNQTGIWDLLFFHRVRNVVGNRIRAIVCGGAPISTDVLRFTRAAFSCPVLPAYGMTESCGVISIGYFGDCETGHVGALCPELTAKLVDVPDFGLSVAHGGVGELVVKGPNCAEGYYNDPEHTRELIDSDGWLHTGDLASWRPNGTLEIVGRCKASFKLSQGEYVSPDKVEAMYQLCPLVDQVYVDGISLYAFAVAVMVPNEIELRRFLLNACPNHVEHKKRWETCSLYDLCADPAVTQLVLSELNRVGRHNGLKGFELAKALHLVAEPFTIANQLLTANLKLSRTHLRRHFSSIIDQLYRETSG